MSNTEAELVRQLFDYSDGYLIHKGEPWGGRRPGDVAGSLSKKGYVNVRFNGRMTRAHRLIFLWHHGFYPPLVDHIDGNKSNNRIENLRGCDKSQNGMNRHVVQSSTGLRNVYRSSNGFVVSLSLRGKRLHVGRFSCIEQAAKAAKQARAKHFGEFA